MDNIIRLRSLAWVEEHAELPNDRATWIADVQKLSWPEFEILMEPLLANNRERLQALPSWSREQLFKRWLSGV